MLGSEAVGWEGGVAYGLAGWAALKGKIRQCADDLTDKTERAVGLAGTAWNKLKPMEDSQDGVTPGNLQETGLGMLTFFLFLSSFLPYTFSILHLCFVRISTVRNPKRQLENCLKKDHIVCANQSRQQNGMGRGCNTQLPPKLPCLGWADTNPPQ